MTGRIHSLETMGTVDGPACAWWYFFKDAHALCLCHNQTRGMKTSQI